MNTFTKLAAGAAGLAAFAAAAPAAAQYNNQSNVIGSILQGVLGYGQYPYGNYGYGQQTYRASQVAVDQCARAAEARLNNVAMNNQYNQWNPYNNPYSNYAVRGQARVLGIDRVEQRKYGRLRVKGVATSGRNYQNGWGYGGQAYNRQYGVPDLKFTCKADASGRVYSVDFNRISSGYRGR
ncbi:MAG: hypothetical protein ABIO29_06130 [Sphingomicrobium sp.]